MGSQGEAETAGGVSGCVRGRLRLDGTRRDAGAPACTPETATRDGHGHLPAPGRGKPPSVHPGPCLLAVRQPSAGRLDGVHLGAANAMVWQDSALPICPARARPTPQGDAESSRGPPRM